MKLLEELCLSYGFSGFEDYGTLKIIKENLNNLRINYNTGKFNSILAEIPGAKKFSILLDAHTDEVFMLVKGIEENGFISFIPNGLDKNILAGQEVVILGKMEITGIITSIPPHLQAKDELKTPYKEDELFIDTGLKTSDLREIVDVGTPIGFKRNYISLSRTRICANALDNRIGVFILLELCKKIKRTKNLSTLYLMFSSQEEEGLRGARVGIYSLKPDLSIVIDVTFANQPDADSRKTSELGKGPVISIGPNYNRKYSEIIRGIAHRIKINIQSEIEAKPGGTNANVINIANGGIPVVGLSVPIRNMHSPSEICDINDVKSLIRLLEEVVKSDIIYH